MKYVIFGGEKKIETSEQQEPTKLDLFADKNNLSFLSLSVKWDHVRFNFHVLFLPACMHMTSCMREVRARRKKMLANAT